MQVFVPRIRYQLYTLHSYSTLRSIEVEIVVDDGNRSFKPR
uniref:Uncharacterized protein n=1 Tax=Mammaliicoccus phage MSShimriz1 TaxID=3230127 RepID=A0AAU8GVP1_9VIRU